MIEIVNVRNNGMEHRPITKHEPLGAALYHMVRNEFCDGGKVVAVSKTSITVETNALGCIDRYTFSGPEQEMVPFFDIAFFWMQSSGAERAVFDAIQQFGSNRHTRPGRVRDAGALLLGNRRLFVATMLGMNVSTREDIAFGLTLSFDDLFSVLLLVSNEPGHSLQELAAQFELTSGALQG